MVSSDSAGWFVYSATTVLKDTFTGQGPFRGPSLQCESCEGESFAKQAVVNHSLLLSCLSDTGNRQYTSFLNPKTSVSELQLEC